MSLGRELALEVEPITQVDVRCAIRLQTRDCTCTAPHRSFLFPGAYWVLRRPRRPVFLHRLELHVCVPLHVVDQSFEYPNTTASTNALRMHGWDKYSIATLFKCEIKIIPPHPFNGAGLHIAWNQSEACLKGNEVI
jgi:hypothetical protein